MEGNQDGYPDYAEELQKCKDFLAQYQVRRNDQFSRSPCSLSCMHSTYMVRLDRNGTAKGVQVMMLRFFSVCRSRLAGAKSFW